MYTDFHKKFDTTWGYTFGMYYSVAYFLNKHNGFIPNYTLVAYELVYKKMYWFTTMR